LVLVLFLLEELKESNVITSHLVNFTLVTKGEAVNDDMITVGADVVLAMSPTMDVMLLVDVTFNLSELDDDTRAPEV